MTNYDEQLPKTPPAYRFNDPRQERIYRRLLLVGPGPAAFYRDVCRLTAAGPVVDTTTHLVAHLLREIESAIRDVLLPRGHFAPKGKGKHRAEIEAILRAYGIDPSDPAAVAWLRLSDEAHDERLAPFAHRDSLGAPRRLDDAFREFVTEVEAIFDVVLQRFEGRFLGSLPVIDELLKKTPPTEADVKVLRGRVPNNDITFEYFFARADAPEWLELLASEGFFTRPPDPVRDDEKGAMRFPPWPESRYLSRIADRAELQGRVVELALAIPDTANINVHEDVVNIALAVPAPVAARLIPRIKQWLASPYQLRLLHRMGNLVAHLARGGEPEAALELSAAFLTILPDPDVKDVAVGDKTWRLPPHPRTAHDEWLVEEFLKETLPILVDAAGEGALHLACKALDDAVRLSRSRTEEAGPEDYSAIWRPAINDHGGNLEHELKSTLVAAVRRSAEQLIERDPSQIGEIVAVLESYGWTIFSRIALHVLTGASRSALPLVEARLGQKDRFIDGGQKREFVLLAQTWFARLSPDLQRTILGWIDEGPDLDAARRWRTELGGEPPSDAELAEYADRWRLEYLRALRDALPAEWRERYRRLVERYGEPEGPESLSVRISSGWVAPESPLTADEVRQASVPDIVTRLNAWQPAGEFMGPSPEGLSRVLASAAEESPARFASDAERFRDVEPTYVRGIITGLRDAVNKERPFDWAPVLKLCQWVVDQPVGSDDGGGPFERDRGWRWTRKTIVGLLEVGFKAGPCEIPFVLRDQVWKVLRLLTDDTDPATATTDQADPEPLATAINTTRGAAMEAAVKYALWVKEHLDRTGDARAEGGLQHMPEVRDVLEAHLDPARDASAAIRAVYGRWLPWLVLLDAEWVTANLARMFPTDERLAYLRDAAWDTYVVFCPVYDNVADVLKGEYARATERVAQMRRVERRQADPVDHLAEHLMVLYWRGKIDLNGPELTRFYADAEDRACGHAMWFVGRVFAKGDGEPPADMIERLKRLFEARLAILRVAPDRHRKELQQFGSWLAAGRFGDEWSLATLQEVLRLTGRVEPDSLVMKQLVNLAPRRPGDVVECVRLMVEGADEYWKVEAWQNEIRKIATVALEVGGPAREAAITLVNMLGARGHMQFRDLLGGDGRGC